MRDERDRDAANEHAIVEFMARVSALPQFGTLPDSSYLWWKAQFLRRRDAMRHATFPVKVMQALEIAAGVVVAAWLSYASVWPLVRPYMN